MYKTKLLFIFLGLIIPLLYSKAIIGDEFVRETNIKRGKADPNHNLDNSEEVLDFWDFDTSKAPGKPKSGSLPVLKPNKAGKNGKVYGTKAEREKVKEIDDLLKEMDQMLSMMENKPVKAPRVLEAVVASPSPSELTTMNEDAGEGSFNEETILPPGDEEEEQEETDEEDPDGNDDETDVEEGVEEEYYNGGGVAGNIPDDGMSTVKLYALLRYDMTLQQFANQGGQQYFLDRTSEVLQIDQDIMRILSIRQGSVIIEFEVVLTGGEGVSQQELERRIQEIGNLLNDAVSSGKMNFFDGAAILNYEPQIIIYSNTPSKENPSGSGYIIGLTIGLSFLTLVGITYFLLKNKKTPEPRLLHGRQQIYKASMPESQVNLDLEDKVNEPNEASSFEESDSMKIYAASVSPGSKSGSGSGSDEENRERQIQRDEDQEAIKKGKKNIFPKIQIA